MEPQASSALHFRFGRMGGVPLPAKKANCLNERWMDGHEGVDMRNHLWADDWGIFCTRCLCKRTVQTDRVNGWCERELGVTMLCFTMTFHVFTVTPIISSMMR